ncbi:MAG: hypothetical protein HOZ81_11835 [Streptomyces sp.]|nr:hypothetical protein [Streptomyces sp.]
MTAPLTPDCPVCAVSIDPARRGRPAIYCSKLCRQAAHRARTRLQQARQDAAWTRRRLAAAVTEFQVLAAELGNAHAALTALAVGGPACDPDQAPPTGWEPELAELARRAASLATTIAGTARSHQATAADYATPPASQCVGISQPFARDAVNSVHPGTQEIAYSTRLLPQGKGLYEADGCTWAW